MRKDEILTVLQVPGVGRETCKRFTRYINNAESSSSKELYSWLEDFSLIEKRVRLPEESDFLKITDNAKRIIDNCEQSGVHIIKENGKYWPEQLSYIKNSPVLLFAAGNICTLDEPFKVAIIGTRKPTEHGAKVARKLGQIFATEGLCVVSGLANGCDENGHIGALAASGKTISILPSPLDNIMPESNRELATEIVANGGLLLTEYEPGHAVRRGNYIERDRLQSALSQAVVVVETEKTGGTMHTVSYCMEQKRLLACYKHNGKYNGLPQTEGNRLLLDEGKALSLHDKNSLKNLIEKIKKYKFEDGKINEEQLSLF